MNNNRYIATDVASQVIMALGATPETAVRNAIRDTGVEGDGFEYEWHTARCSPALVTLVESEGDFVWDDVWTYDSEGVAVTMEEAHAED